MITLKMSRVTASFSGYPFFECCAGFSFFSCRNKRISYKILLSITLHGHSAPLCNHPYFFYFIYI